MKRVVFEVVDILSEINIHELEWGTLILVTKRNDKKVIGFVYYDHYQCWIQLCDEGYSEPEYYYPYLYELIKGNIEKFDFYIDVEVSL